MTLEGGQRPIDGDRFDRMGLDATLDASGESRPEARIERLRSAAAALLGQPLARAIDQNPPHHFGGGAEKAPAIVVRRTKRTDEAQIELMDEGGRLERRLMALIGERAMGDPAQLLVENGEQTVGRGAIPSPPRPEEVRDLAWTSRLARSAC